MKQLVSSCNAQDGRCGVYDIGNMGKSQYDRNRYCQEGACPYSYKKF